MFATVCFGLAVAWLVYGLLCYWNLFSCFGFVGSFGGDLRVWCFLLVLGVSLLVLGVYFVFAGLLSFALWLDLVLVLILFVRCGVGCLGLLDLVLCFVRVFCAVLVGFLTLFCGFVFVFVLFRMISFVFGGFWFCCFEFDACCIWVLFWFVLLFGFCVAWVVYCGTLFAC